jgi:hypothetical protein
MSEKPTQQTPPKPNLTTPVPRPPPTIPVPPPSTFPSFQPSTLPAVTPSFAGHYTPRPLPHTYVTPSTPLVTSSIPFDTSEDYPSDIPLCTITSTTAAQPLPPIRETSMEPTTPTQLQQEMESRQHQYDTHTLLLQQQIDQLQQSLEQANQRSSQLEFQQSYFLNNTQATNTNIKLSSIISKPESFSGNVNTFDTFVFSMRNYLLLSSVPPQLHVQTAGTFLTGTAGTWFAYLTPAERNSLTTFDQFATLLTNYFSPLDQQAEARRKLTGIRQTSSVTAFNNIFNQTVQRLPHMEMAEKIEQYRMKLHDDLQVQLALNEYTSLADIMKAAVRIDALLIARKPKSSGTFQFNPRQQYSNRKPFTNTNASASNTQPVAAHAVQLEDQPGSDEDEHHVNYTQAAPISKLTPEARQHCIENKLCFRCRKAGHNKFHCPLNSSNRQQTTSFQPSPAPSKSHF